MAASSSSSTPGPSLAPPKTGYGQPTVQQIKTAEVPKRLQDGEEFIKWDESSGVGTPVILHIDENGFFLYWTDQTTKEVLELLDLTSIRDARTGKYAKIPKDHKIRGKVESGMKVESSKADTPDSKDKSIVGQSDVKLAGKGDSEEDRVDDKMLSLCLEDCTVTICHGSDFVNLTFVNFYTTKKESAQLWTDEITKLIFSLSLLNSSTMRFLLKVHTRLCLQVDKSGNIPVKSIIKLFTTNKDDKKRVEEALQSVYGPNVTKDKTSVLSPTQFTFEEHFYPIYKNLMQRTEVQKIYDSLCNSTTKMIGVNEFMQFLNGTQRDPRLNEILHPYAKSHNVQTLIEQYEKKKEYVNKHLLSFDAFLRYLMGDDNPIIAASKLEISNPESMEHPLAHYFINSSHNTYLTGHQITGKSSVEIYRQCLLAGCRCVELDFWNGPKDEPCIVHGYTFVPEVSAREVIEAIAESAFKTSEYPVILSFENHCNRKQQTKIAEYCREIFGDMLLDAPLDSHSLKGDSLPPPSLLKRKIIIKNKKKKKGETSSGSSDAETSPVAETAPGTDKGPGPLPAECVVTPSEASQAEGTPTNATESAVVSRASESESVERDDVPSEGSSVEQKPQEDDNAEAEDEKDSADTKKESDDFAVVEDAVSDVTIAPENMECIQSPKPTKASNGDLVQARAAVRRRQASGDDDDDSSSDDDAEPDKPDKEKASKTKETEAGEEISALVNYVQPVHFVSFEKALEKKRFYEMSSFDEKQALSLVREYPTEFVNYNKRQLSRVYPAGIRFDSSNFMPQLFWNAGCQLVALNYQTLDVGMQYNLGIFENNQRCGYLLKPEFMRREDRQLDIFSDSRVDGIVAGTLKVYVLSGQFLSDKRINTYVEVNLYGLPADSLRKKFRTRVVPNNGINPVYVRDDEKDVPFDCNIVVLPELASIRIAAYEESGKLGKLIGHRILPLVGLCPGYRHVTLRNEAGQPILATLFLMIKVNDFVPDQFSMFAEALANPTEYQNKLEKHSTMLAGLTEEIENDDMENDSLGIALPKARHGAHNGDGSKILCDRSMSDADETAPGMVPGMIAPPKLTNKGSFAGLLGQAGVAASSAAAGAAAGASAAASITAKRHSIAPTAQAAAVDKGSVVRSTSGEISNLQEQAKKELTVETLEELMKSKSVREKRQEMDKKLEALRKKHEKERSRLQIQRGSQEAEKSKTKFYMSNKLVKRLSRQNISSGVPDVSSQHEGEDTETEGSQSALNERFMSVIREQLAQEKELQKKYHEMVFASITKTVESSQANQLKTIKALQDRDTAEMMRRLEATRRKEMKELAKKHKDREEMDKMRRELASNAVERGVSERVRLDEIYEHKKKDLEEKYQSVRTSLEAEKKKVEDALQHEFDERLTNIKREVQLREMQIASTSDPHDVQ